MGTGESDVASWLIIPNSIRAVERITPINIMLFTIGRYLILLDEIEASYEWIQSIKPKIMSKYNFSEKTCHEWVFQQKEGISDGNQVDLSALATADLSMTAGACFAMGLKYMGTQNERAAKVLEHVTKELIQYLKPEPAMTSFNDFVSITILEHAIGKGLFCLLRSIV